MMHHEEVDLQSQNSLALPCIAKSLVKIRGAQDLKEALEANIIRPENFLVLGGGSNLVLPPRLDTPVVQVEMFATSYQKISDDEWRVEAEAGVVWDSLVAECVDRQLHGIENLSLIPGKVGAAPVQNIGAYGVEVSDVLEYVSVFDIKDRVTKKLSAEQCEFSYRDSLFKREAGRYVILKVALKLSESACFNLEYGPLKALKESEELDIALVRETVISVRKAKIPLPHEIPNVGSFFKNPIISNERFERLRERFSNLVSYPESEKTTKLAAGWLIENAGWKGYRAGDVGVHDQQALVLVNEGRGSQKDVLDLAKRIQESVNERFGVVLEIEPVVIE